MAHARPVWPPSDQLRFLAVRNQAPMLSYTNVFEIGNMVHLTPAATTDRAATVTAGDSAPDFRIVRTDGVVATLDTFRGKPTVLRLTRAVAERFI